MRAQLHQASGEILPQNDDFQIDETVLDVHMKQAIARMLDWCARSPNVSTFMARGFVVDTLSDISSQITDFFPRSINVTPIIDDLSFVVAQSARRTGQRYQEVALDYISDGKIPEAAQANKQSFVKWYSVENVIGGDFDGHAKKLRPGWSGGAGSPTDMLKHLNLGTKKGFLLQVNALDIQDAKAQSLGADTGMMQAMGGSAAAMKEAGDAVAAGGVEAAKAQAVIEAIVEIKTIKAALTQAGDTPQAAPLAAALALKTDALATTVGQIKLPAAMQAETARVVEVVRIDMSAKQITTALQTIVNNMPAIITARPANDGAGPAGLASQMVKSIAALQIASQTANLPMRDVIALALTKQAPPALADAVKAVTTQLARKEALPVLDRLLPPAAAVTVRTMLTTPALKTVAQTPVAVAPVVAQIKALAAQMAAPAVATAAVQAPVQAGAAKAAATPVTDALAPKGATPTASAPTPVGTPAVVVATAGPSTNAAPALSVPKVTEISSAAAAPVSAAPVLSVVSSAKGAFAQPASPLAAPPSAPSLPAAAVGIAAPAAAIAPSTTAGATPASATTQVQAPAAPATVAVKTPTTIAPATAAPAVSAVGVPAAAFTNAPATASAPQAQPLSPSSAFVAATPVANVAPANGPAVATATGVAPVAVTATGVPAAAPLNVAPVTTTITAGAPVSAPATTGLAVATPPVVAAPIPSNAPANMPPAVPATPSVAAITPVTPATASAPQAQPFSPSSAFVVVAPAQTVPVAAPAVNIAGQGPAPAASPIIVQQPDAMAAAPIQTAPVTAPAMQSYEAPVAVAAPPPVQPAQATPVQAPQAPVQQAEMQRVEAPAPANTNIAPSTPVENAQQEPKLRVVIDPVEAQHVVEPSALRNMAEETVKMAAIVLNDSKNATPQSGAEMAQAVADNLQAVANNPAITDVTKSELTVLVAEAQVVGQQAKNGQYVPDIPQQPTLLNPQAPLAEMTRAVDVKTPTGVTEPTEAVARHMDMLRNDANIARQNVEMPVSNDQASPFSIKTTPKATEADKAKEEVKRGCGDCKNNFNCKTCGTQTPEEKKQTDADLSAAKRALQARNAELGHNRPAMS